MVLIAHNEYALVNSILVLYELSKFEFKVFSNFVSINNS